MTLPITITITASTGDHFRTEMPGGPVEASSPWQLWIRSDPHVQWLVATNAITMPKITPTAAATVSVPTTESPDLLQKNVKTTASVGTMRTGQRRAIASKATTPLNFGEGKTWSPKP